MNELFQTYEIVDRTTPSPNPEPFFILAYYGPSRRWSVRHGYEAPDCLAITDEIRRLREKGWSHITVCRLPDLTRDNSTEQYLRECHRALEHIADDAGLDVASLLWYRAGAMKPEQIGYVKK